MPTTKPNRPNPAYPRPDPVNPYIDANGLPTTSPASTIPDPQPGTAAATGQAIAPKSVVGPDVYVPGGGSGTPPSSNGPSGPAARAAGMTSGNVQPRGPAPTQAPPPPDAGPPGSDTYDWHTINRTLINSQMDGWQIAGSSHQPVPIATFAANPSYNKLLTPQENQDAGNGEEYILKPSSDYVISVTNPATGQMMTLHLGKSTPDANGNYGYVITKREDAGKIDKVNPGYANPQTLTFDDGHAELWGTNSGTGVFEKMPGSPPNLGTKKGWNDIKQIDGVDPATGKRAKIWVGTDPSTGQPLTPIPGAPTVPTDRFVPGSLKQVTKNGKLIWRGQDPQTQEWVDAPDLGSEVKPQTTTTIRGNVYTPDPDTGLLVIAQNIPQPHEGSERWVDATTGKAKHQVFTNGDWQDDTDTPWKTVDPSLQRAEAALKKKGEKYWMPLNGSPDTMIEVTADGNGGYTYEFGPNGEPPKVQKISGIREPTSAGGAGGEFLPQRRDPYTQQLLPPEKDINWNPTTAGDRVRQLQERAHAKQTEIHAQVTSGALSEDQADQQFKDWWASNIEPSRQEIQIAQRSKQQSDDRANLQIAQNAGSSAVTAAQGLHYVGPGFGDLWGKITQGYGKDMPNNITSEDITRGLVTEAPDFSKIYEDATAKALAHISPTAASIANGQGAMPSALQGPLDVTAGLEPTRYLYSGAGGPPAPPTAGGAGGAQTGGYNPKDIQWNQAANAANVPGRTMGPGGVITGGQPLPPVSSAAVPGQSYDASVAYTGGVPPWLAQPGPAIPDFRRLYQPLPYILPS